MRLKAETLTVEKQRNERRRTRREREQGGKQTIMREREQGEEAVRSYGMTGSKNQRKKEKEKTDTKGKEGEANIIERKA